MTSSSASIRFNAISHQYQTAQGSMPVLQSLDFEIEANQFVAILGPSGCGKSTLLRIASGLLKPSAGNLQVGGISAEKPLENIGIVFQKPTLLPWATILDNVLFPIRHQSGTVSKAQRAEARQLLDTFGLADFEQCRPDQLSGGMQQRVGIARALILDPDILLMDEPFSALDALKREEIGFDLLDKWQAKPKTVLFVTHSIPEAVLLADRILVMSERPGTIVEDIKVPLPRPRSLESADHPEATKLASNLRKRLLKRSASTGPQLAC